MRGIPGFVLMLIFGSVIALGSGCAIEALDAVLEGRCNEGRAHCVDSQTIQFCSGELWQAPQECLPETSGEPPVQVEILTYCSEDGCRPGG